MTVEEFDKFVGELDKICEKYKTDIEFVVGKYEPVDIEVIIRSKIEEG